MQNIKFIFRSVTTSPLVAAVPLLMTLMVVGGCRTTGSASDIAAASVTDCRQVVNQNSCTYYDCMETAKSCGDEGYAKAYGSRYCKKFQGMCDQTLTSARARKWVEGTTKCLQNKLSDFFDAQVAIQTSPSCELIRKSSFDAHPYCYTTGAVKNGGVSFCTLSTSEWFSIRACVAGSDRHSRDGLAQIVAVGARCTPLIGGLFNLNQFDKDSELSDGDLETIAYLKTLPADELRLRAVALEKMIAEITSQLARQ